MTCRDFCNLKWRKCSHPPPHAHGSDRRPFQISKFWRSSSPRPRVQMRKIFAFSSLRPRGRRWFWGVNFIPPPRPRGRLGESSNLPIWKILLPTPTGQTGPAFKSLKFNDSPPYAHGSDPGETSPPAPGPPKHTIPALHAPHTPMDAHRSEPKGHTKVQCEGRTNWTRTGPSVSTW